MAELNLRATVVPVRDHRAGMDLLSEDKLDAYFADRAIIAAMLHEGGRPGFPLSKRYFSYETYALALPRDDGAFRLLVDRTLARLYRTRQDRRDPRQDLRPRAARRHAQGDDPDPRAAGQVVTTVKSKPPKTAIAASRRGHTHDRRRGDHRALLAHGIDTVYALPGVQNDLLFDALFKASDRLRTVHTRHEQGAAYMALGAALATGKPHAYAVVPGPGLLNSGRGLLTAYSMNAPVLALIGEIPEPTSAAISATCTRSATRPASSRGWSIIPRASASRPGAAPGRRGDARDGDRPARPGRAANARSTSGARPRSVDAGAADRVRAPEPRRDARSARRRSFSARAKPDDRLRRRRAGRFAEVTGCPPCCRRRCSAIAAAAACSTAAIR